MPMPKLKNIIKLKESMTVEQKKRLLITLKSLREEYTGNIGGETDIRNADNMMVAEDEFTATDQAQPNVIAKTFDTQADFDSYVNQRRGIQMTPKEQQAILDFKKAKPTQQDKFFVKFETTDNFGTNNTTTIKKLRDGNQFTWVAFTKHENAEDEGQPKQDVKEAGDEVTVDDPIRITKTITFTDETQGSDILADLLNSGKLGI